VITYIVSETREIILPSSQELDILQEAKKICSQLANIETFRDNAMPTSIHLHNLIGIIEREQQIHMERTLV